MAAEWLLQTLSHLWRLLQSLEVPAALMGGLAMSVWKHVRSTRDVDLLLGIDVSQLNLFLEQLHAAGFHAKREPPVISLGKLKILQFLYEPPDSFMSMQVDFLLADSPYHRQALDRRIKAWLPDSDLQIDVLTCEDLILNKLLAGRLIDKADVASLLALTAVHLDRKYLIAWLSSLKLTADFSAIWQEVFPGQAFGQE
jgi:hypothetical protein